ncbi:MAG: hypothetical protein EHM23_35430 [Acidobacteria bacterium]|nr:MAG: hypothetical protein EHM23_35430 [Acidobacteriota bacterium]
MSECECVSTCDFFNEQMKGLEAIKEMMKRRYCLGDNSDCARHMVFQELGKGRVPPDLIPNQTEKVRNIITRFRMDEGPAS